MNVKELEVGVTYTQAGWADVELLYIGNDKVLLRSGGSEIVNKIGEFCNGYSRRKETKKLFAYSAADGWVKWSTSLVAGLDRLPEFDKEVTE